MTVKMWVIGGTYRLGCEDLRLDEMFRHEFGKLMAWFTKSELRSSKSILFTDFTGFSGPTHVPCPICALMQQVSTDGLQIDLAEHLMRHHPSEWKKQQEAEQPSSGDPGEGWRILKPNETVQYGDQFKTSVSEHWRVCDFSIGQLVEDCEDNVFRRRIETPSEAAATPDCSVDPGAGYRILGKQEALREGDEFLVEGVWLLSSNILQGGCQSPGITYRRKLTYPPGPGVGFRFVDAAEGNVGFRFIDAAEGNEDTDEIWSFVTEEWKSLIHVNCREFGNTPVVRRRRVTEGIEKKSDVKPADRKMQQNCVFFTFSGESFAILLTPDGKVSLHRRVPCAGLAMIVERSSFEELVEGRRNCLLEVLLKAGVRLPVASQIVDADENEFFSLGFIQAASSAWAKNEEVAGR